MDRIITVNPTNGIQLNAYEYHTASEIEVRLARSSSTYALWRNVPLARRLECLTTLSKILMTEMPNLAALATREMGKPFAQARLEIEKCAMACTFYSEAAPDMLARRSVAIPSGRAYVAYESLGPVLGIMPWNFPYWQVLRVAAPALAAGNTVLLKHAENTTGVALEIERLALAAGFPAGALQALKVDHSQIPRIIADERVRAISLTGSERAGRIVAALAGAALKKSVLELGGSDPYVVLADADIESAAEICVRARLVNGGQSCVAAKRFIIDTKVYDAFVRAFVARANRYVVGDPMDPHTALGPLAKRSIRDEVATQVTQSVAQGATLLLGGAPLPGSGFFYQVTVLGEVVPGMPAFDEEVFGPAAALIRAKDEADAIKLANLSRFGLGAAVFSRDKERAELLARDQLEAGFVVVNGMVQSDPRLPFGGIKASGYGRELSSEGLREFVNVKTVIVA